MTTKRDRKIAKIDSQNGTFKFDEAKYGKIDVIMQSTQ